MMLAAHDVGFRDPHQFRHARLILVGPVLVPRGAQGKLLPHEQAVLVAKFVEPALLQVGPAPHPQNIAAEIPVELDEAQVMLAGEVAESRQDRSIFSGERSLTKGRLEGLCRSVRQPAARSRAGVAAVASKAREKAA